mmetsp:Transcript_35025/g.100766  ORF Transcript_35025/g.100766 Transcript_35025/m.100766 type:complete len:124 (-) Transcript_35025:1376-1747(-)
MQTDGEGEVCKSDGEREKESEIGQTTCCVMWMKGSWATAGWSGGAASGFGTWPPLQSRTSALLPPLLHTGGERGARHNRLLLEAVILSDEQADLRRWLDVWGKVIDDCLCVITTQHDGSCVES